MGLLLFVVVVVVVGVAAFVADVVVAGVNPNPTPSSLNFSISHRNQLCVAFRARCPLFHRSCRVPLHWDYPELLTTPSKATDGGCNGRASTPIFNPFLSGGWLTSLRAIVV